jgi:hypothetical protein
MAGERLRPPGWTEISAVCTDPGHRGQGLATRLVRAVAAGIRERGDTPFLHASATNTGAIRLYESIGFTLRRRSAFLLVRTPAGRRGPKPSLTATAPGGEACQSSWWSGARPDVDDHLTQGARGEVPLSAGYGRKRGPLGGRPVGFGAGLRLRPLGGVVGRPG